MTISIKTFNELTTRELYELLQLRSEVFVVEQNCVYQDVDDKDQKAIHVLGKKNNKIVAYTRAFKPGDYFDNPAIGRVVVKTSERKYGFGRVIMKATIDYIENTLKGAQIELSAQTYLIKFYNSLGFFEQGKEYLEDDIPHIKMIKP
ncbi:GNAT family N-acetyltransferase [Croceitalea sp. P059]|uniref:GNAT family N-acetyltransferase n=1 Tax=Croceitalea sp. P059 TaxID=3075601 RepID=UPI0028881F9C|nr:GNAT family N-acetyltransferase [Croceitalea sp. P059]MDT0538668.1 GNAT family N-acetyltransferase [Croceitalea sp. P059]